MLHYVIGCLLTVALGSAHAAEAESPWLEDLEKARTAAREQGKPIFVVFR